MVANFRPAKDHSTLLRAWKRIVVEWTKCRPKPRLLLAGVPQQSYDSVRHIAVELKLQDSVSFLGQVNDVSGLLAASDVGVLATNHEGLPNVVIEYMASRLPVVATDLPGCREALGDDPQQRFARLGDEESLAGSLRNLLDDPGLRRKLGERNQRRAAQEFSVQRMCAKTTSIIVGLLDRRYREAVMGHD
jgi:glycosyltransferase involved in cell wall biosynthesis